MEKRLSSHFGKAINAVNFAVLAIFVDNQEVDLAENEVSGFSVALDMQTGVLRRTFTVFGVQFCLTKFFSVAQKELALMRDGVGHLAKSCENRIVYRCRCEKRRCQL